MAGKAAAGPAERLDVKLSTLFLLICGLDNEGRFSLLVSALGYVVPAIMGHC